MHRTLTLLLIRQVRIVDGLPPSGDYAFAKYNKVLTGYLLNLFSFGPIYANALLPSYLRLVEVLS